MKMFRFVDIYRFVSVADATEDANGCRHSERTGQFVSGSGKRDSPITRPKVETNSESVEEDKNLKIEKASIPAEPITNEQIKTARGLPIRILDWVRIQVKCYRNIVNQ